MHCTCTTAANKVGRRQRLNEVLRQIQQSTSTPPPLLTVSDKSTSARPSSREQAALPCGLVQPLRPLPAAAAAAGGDGNEEAKVGVRGRNRTRSLSPEIAAWDERGQCCVLNSGGRGCVFNIEISMEQLRTGHARQITLSPSEFHRVISSEAHASIKKIITSYKLAHTDPEPDPRPYSPSTTPTPST